MQKAVEFGAFERPWANKCTRLNASSAFESGRKCRVMYHDGSTTSTLVSSVHNVKHNTLII